jgi:hypothetical protein
MANYEKGAEDERELVALAGGTGHRLAMRSPQSLGTFDVLVIEANGSGMAGKHLVWLINCKRNDWAPPDERLALAVLADRHHCIPVLANHELRLVNSRQRLVWFFRGVRKNGDMTDVWSMPPWDMR